MTPARKLRGAFLVLQCAALALATPVIAKAEDHAGDRWVPVVSLGAGLHWQKASGNLRADPAPGVTFAGFGSADGTAIYKPALLCDLELSSPAWETGPGKPRVFALIGAVVPLGGSTSVDTAIGDSGGSARDPQLFLTLEWDALWYSGLGISFELPVLGRTLVIKPSIAYIGQTVTWRATMEQQIDTALGSPLVSFTESDGQLYQGLSGRLQLETALSPLGPFTPVVFFEGMVGGWLWGERSGELLVDSFASDGRPSFETRSRFHLDRVTFNFGGGIRLKWYGL